MACLPPLWGKHSLQNASASGQSTATARNCGQQSSGLCTHLHLPQLWGNKEIPAITWKYSRMTKTRTLHEHNWTPKQKSLKINSQKCHHYHVQGVFLLLSAYRLFSLLLRRNQIGFIAWKVLHYGWIYLSLCLNSLNSQKMFIQMLSLTDTDNDAGKHLSHAVKQNKITL